MKKISITKKISVTTIGLIAMLMLLAAPVSAGKDSDMEKEGERARGSERGATAGETTGQDAILASSLMDYDVQDAEGNKVGSVSDIMIGPDGNVEYIVLSEGASFLGFGDTDLIPVPWNKVNTGQIGEDQDAVMLSLSKEELENAPVFNEDEWQAFLQGERQQEVRGYYGTEDDDDRQPGQEQMMEEQNGDAYEMEKEESEGKDKERRY